MTAAGRGAGGGVAAGGLVARAGLLSFDFGAEQGAYQGQFGLHGAVVAVELQRLAVSLAGQPGIDIAQVFMGGGVAGVGAYGHFQRGAGFVKLVLVGVEHGQVVVGLGQLRVVLGDFGEGGDGVGWFAGFGLDHAFDKAHLRVARLAHQVLVGFGQGFGQLAGAGQVIDVGVLVGMRCRQPKGRGQRQQAQGARQGLAGKKA
jgi:hypothetical protein